MLNGGTKPIHLLLTNPIAKTRGFKKKRNLANQNAKHNYISSSSRFYLSLTQYLKRDSTKVMPKMMAPNMIPRDSAIGIRSWIISLS